MSHDELTPLTPGAPDARARGSAEHRLLAFDNVWSVTAVATAVVGVGAGALAVGLGSGSASASSPTSVTSVSTNQDQPQAFNDDPRTFDDRQGFGPSGGGGQQALGGSGGS